MSTASPKLQAHKGPPLIRVFYVGIDRTLTQVSAGEEVWPSISSALKALENRKNLMAISRALSKAGYESFLFILRVRQDDVRSNRPKGRSRKPASKWFLRQNTPIEKRVDAEDMEALRVELIFGGEEC